MTTPTPPADPVQAVIDVLTSFDLDDLTLGQSDAIKAMVDAGIAGKSAATVLVITEARGLGLTLDDVKNLPARRIAQALDAAGTAAALSAPVDLEEAADIDPS